MPTATKQTATKAAPYDVGRPGGDCIICNQTLPPGETIMAGLREEPTGFARFDAHVACWPQVDKTNLLAFWRTTVPTPSAKKKVFVDDAVLCELFERLADTTEQNKVNFRFVLGLILMRKRMLIYETSRFDDQHRDVWSVRLRGKEAILDLINPRLTEQQVAEVSTQMGEILNEEL